jgi:esterase/lipase superfamily enzyme
VLKRFLTLAVVLVAAAGVAAGQTPPDAALPAPCSAEPPQDLPALEKRKEQLERRVRRSILPGTRRKRQEELLKVIFEIECLKSLEREEVVEILEAPRTALMRSVRRPQNIVEVTTWYATNRSPSGSTEPAKLYGLEVASGLTYGRAVVTIPTTHTPGNIELPSIWRLERQPDPKRHFVLKSVSPAGLDAVRAEMKARLDGTDTKVVLLFVHGYNVGFPEAAMRTAQLAYDLRFSGVPMFFSWPSAAQTLAYMQDAEAAQLSEGAFDRVLEDLAALPATDVYVVAHSMGSRIVTQVLKSRVERGRPTRHVSELLLAAPDINAKLFRDVIAPKLAALERTRTTIYASSSDLALKASRTMHGFERVGDTSGKVFVYKGMETIDASKVSLVMRAFGHSYLMDSKSVLKDLHTIVRQRLPAKMRGLTETGKLPDVYWRIE